MQRIWTNVGKLYTDGCHSCWEKAFHKIIWCKETIPDEMSSSSLLTIKEIIKKLQVPKVSNIGINNQIGIYGIEGNYQNGKARIYLLGSGSNVTVIASDFWPHESNKKYQSWVSIIVKKVSRFFQNIKGHTCIALSESGSCYICTLKERSSI